MTRIDISAADAKAVTDVIAIAADLVAVTTAYDATRKTYLVDADTLDKLAAAVDEPAIRRFVADVRRQVNL